MRALEPGDQVKFHPKPGNTWWNVRVRDDRFVICTRQAPFRPKGESEYTVVDLTGWTFRYNGVRPGVVRSSINLIGGGYAVDETGACEQMLKELQDGELELSRRRVLNVESWEVRG